MNNDRLGLFFLLNKATLQANDATEDHKVVWSNDMLAGEELKV